MTTAPTPPRGGARRRGRRAAPARRARPRRRPAAALVAAADRDAHGDRAAVPAGAGRGPGLAAAAARRCRRTRSTRTSPTTRRWRRCSTGSTCSTSSARRGSPRSTCCCSSRSSAACCPARSSTSGRCGPRRPRLPGTCSGCPTPASSARRWPPPEALDVVEEELRVRRFRVVRREGELSRPRRATSRRPATCCSTCRWWRCCSAWPAASSGATRAASWSPRARASATRSSSTTPTRPGRWWRAATSPRSAWTSTSSRRSTRRT